jgi:hypothetical protein
MIPPAKKAHPITNSILDNMEPSSDCCTTRTIPFFKAYIAIIISVAFPNVAFRRPPTAVQGRQEWSLLEDSAILIAVSHKKKQTYLLDQWIAQVACRTIIDIKFTKGRKINIDFINSLSCVTQTLCQRYYS